jgi:hypothetical protein
MRPRIGLALLALVVTPFTVSGQELARRVSSVDDGIVRLTYPTKPGVEICDQGVRIGDRQIMWHSQRYGDEPENCRVGPAEIEVKVRQGRVTDVDLVRKVSDRSGAATDLGSVSASEAVDFLLAAARTGGSGDGEEEAVFPATIADVQDIWRELLVLARDRGVDEDVRTASVFWVGQEAADAATEGLAEMAMDGDEEQGVRSAAVFALSQRPNGEALPLLMDIARTAPGAETRRNAMFWLAESEDERALAFFEEILLRKGRGG